MLALGAISHPTAVWALGLGAAEVSSALGQPLSMVIPLSGDDAATLSTQCFRVVRGEDSREGITPINVARLTLVRRDGAPALRVETPFAINEPAARVVIEAGCERPVQREFVLLLDPVGLPIAPARSDTAVAEVLPTELDFGAPEVASALGQPLSLRVPVLGSAARTLAVDCVRVTGLSRDTDGTPLAADARVSITRSATATVLRIASSQPINDAAVRVAVEAGCERPLRREFAVILDKATVASAPPPSDAQQVASDALPAPVPAKPRPPAPPPSTARRPPPVALRPATPPAQPPRDRLRLSPADEPARSVPPVVPSPAPATAPATQTGPSTIDPALAQKLLALEADMARLRTELEAAAARNKELAETQRQRELADQNRIRELETLAASARIAWAVAGGAFLLLIGGMAYLWRQRRDVRHSSWYEGAMAAETPARKAAAAEAAAEADLPDEPYPTTSRRTGAPNETIQVTELRVGDARQLMNELEVMGDKGHDGNRDLTRDTQQRKTLKLDLDLGAVPPPPRATAVPPARSLDRPTVPGIDVDESFPTKGDPEPTPRPSALPPLRGEPPLAKQQTPTARERPAPPPALEADSVGRFGESTVPLPKTALMVDLELDPNSTIAAPAPAAPRELSLEETNTVVSGSVNTRPLDLDLELPEQSEAAPKPGSQPDPQQTPRPAGRPAPKPPTSPAASKPAPSPAEARLARASTILGGPDTTAATDMVVDLDVGSATQAGGEPTKQPKPVPPPPKGK